MSVWATDTVHVSDTAQVSKLIRDGKMLVYEYPDSAQDYFEQALKISETIHSPIHHASALNWMGVAHYILGEYNVALPYFNQAFHVSELANDHSGMAASLNHIGLIYEIQGQHKRAIEQHEKAIVHAELANNTERLASNNFNIGLIYDETGDYARALNYVNKALEISQAASHHRLIAMSYNRLGEIQFHMRRYEEAERYYRQALSYEPYQSNWENCFAQSGLAQALREQGRLAEATRHGQEAYRLARVMNAKWEIIRAADILSATYAAEQNYTQAYAFGRIARTVSDSVFNEEKEKELNYIHLQENELQKLKLEQENNLQQAELRYKNLYITLGGIVLLSFVLISLALYARHRQKVRLNQKLSDTNARIEQQNVQLSELNQIKSNLLSIIGHDMRSPLVNLGALLTLIQQDDLEPELRKKFMSDLQLSVDSVSGSLDNLLHWTTSQMDGFETNPVAIDLDHLLEGKIRLWQAPAQGKNITIRHRKQNLNAVADIDQMRTVLRNILGNAIKFTRPGGEVSVSYREHAGMVGIVITDTGVGMSEDKQQSLFLFRPGKRTHGTENEKGSGLGLMISKQFVEKNNGKIRVESIIDEGTTFTIWLPSA